MSDKATNPLAFPRAYSARQRNDAICFRVEDGMTLRDYFAGQALAGILSNTAGNYKASEIAIDSYIVADAMLEARLKT